MDHDSEMQIGPANFHFMLHIYDAQEKHIVTLRLRREEKMSIEDMHQMQKYLWTQIGEVIKENTDLQRRLTYAGVEILFQDPRFTATV